MGLWPFKNVPYVCKMYFFSSKRPPINFHFSLKKSGSHGSEGRGKVKGREVKGRERGKGERGGYMIYYMIYIRYTG